MSGGRVELGIGTGWYDDEHTAYGIPFPPLGERFEIGSRSSSRSSPACGAPRWGRRSTTTGSTTSSPTRPRCRSRCSRADRRSSSAAAGQQKTPRARGPVRLRVQPAVRAQGLLDPPGRACRRRAGRSTAIPDELTYSVALVVCVGEDEAEVERRAPAIGREVDELRENGVCGTPAEAVRRLEEWRDAGAERVYLQVLDLDDLDHIAARRRRGACPAKL